MNGSTAQTELRPTPRETVQSEALYSKVAERYDTVFERAILAEGRLTELVRETMNGRRVLDLACGNGRWLDRFRPAAYTGVDLNRAMLVEAKQRYPSAQFILADMTRIPLADGSFDGVISMFGAMGHLPPEGQRAMVREAHRVLAPGGMAIFTNGNTWSPFALPTTMTGGRVRIEGVRVRVHSTTPGKLARLLTGTGQRLQGGCRVPRASCPCTGETPVARGEATFSASRSAGFRVLRLESYDYSYLPILPLKFTAHLLGRPYEPIYAHWMDLFDHCRYVPTMRWFGKQLVAVCRKA